MPERLSRPATAVHSGLISAFASHRDKARITDRFAAAVHHFAEREQIAWVDFARGQRKDDVMHEHLAAFQAAGRTLATATAYQQAIDDIIHDAGLAA